MVKRFLALCLSLGVVLTFAFSLIGAHISPAGASSARSHTVEVAAKKHHHYHHYSGIKVNSPIWQNDVDTPTTFTVRGVGLTPRAIYDINLTDLEDRCDDAVAVGLPELPADVGVDAGDVRADLEGRLTFTVEIINCVEGKYSITVVNDALSGESHEAHFKIKAA